MEQRQLPEVKESSQTPIHQTSEALANRPFAPQPVKPQSIEATATTVEGKTATSPPSEFSIFNPDGVAPRLIQSKLAIGEPDDKYEQEADRVAQQVVQRINLPVVEAERPRSSAQQKNLPLEKLKKKSLLQRETLSEENELQKKTIFEQNERSEAGKALQAKPDTLQRTETLGGEADQQTRFDSVQSLGDRARITDLQMKPLPAQGSPAEIGTGYTLKHAQGDAFLQREPHDWGAGVEANGRLTWGPTNSLTSPDMSGQVKTTGEVTKVRGKTEITTFAISEIQIKLAEPQKSNGHKANLTLQGQDFTESAKGPQAEIKYVFSRASKKQTVTEKKGGWEISGKKIDLEGNIDYYSPSTETGQCSTRVGLAARGRAAANLGRETQALAETNASAVASAGMNASATLNAEEVDMKADAFVGIDTSISPKITIFAGEKEAISSSGTIGASFGIGGEFGAHISWQGGTVSLSGKSKLAVGLGYNLSYKVSINAIGVSQLAWTWRDTIWDWASWAGGSIYGGVQTMAGYLDPFPDLDDIGEFRLN